MLLHEGLIISRDVFNKAEFVCFTYDLLAGYIIAQYLFEKYCKELTFFSSEDFFTRLLDPQTGRLKHSLSEDIFYSITFLFPIRTGKFLFNILDKKGMDKYSINYALRYYLEILFDLNVKYITADNIVFVRDVFRKGEEDQKIKILQLSEKTYYLSKHPFNINFLSSELDALNLAERDLLWTEYTRKISDQLLNLVGYHENIYKLEHSINQEEIHFGAKKIIELERAEKRLKSLTNVFFILIM